MRPNEATLIPRLTTERLLLREMRASDFDAYATASADPVVMKNQSGGAVDRRTAWRLFTGLAGQWVVTGSGWWMIELAGEPVGTVGAFFRETQLGRGADADLEVGWTVFRSFWRRGIASEAARAALAWSFARHDVKRAIAYIDRPNEASIGVARSIGMTPDGDADFYGQPVLRFALPRPAPFTAPDESNP